MGFLVVFFGWFFRFGVFLCFFVLGLLFWVFVCLVFAGFFCTVGTKISFSFEDVPLKRI